MTTIYILFEFLVMGLFLWMFIKSVRDQKLQNISVILSAAVLVTAGELINNFHSKVTVYNSSFLLWMPKTEIPVFIICGGIVISLAIFMIADRLSSKSIIKKYVFVMLFSMTFPLIEFSGIGSGLWKWPASPPIDPGWVIGVWEFYFIFMGIPALIGCLVPDVLKKTEGIKV